MAMKGRTKCSVLRCSGSVDGYSNLCDNHRVPGTKAVYGESTMLITIWVAEHNGELGFILLNDYALGNLFGGREGFEVKLAEQRFTKVRNVDSPQQLDSERAKVGRAVSWSGPWRTVYPWELE
jgi:hypothetical protein